MKAEFSPQMTEKHHITNTSYDTTREVFNSLDISSSGTWYDPMLFSLFLCDSQELASLLLLHIKPQEIIIKMAVHVAPESLNLW